MIELSLYLFLSGLATNKYLLQIISVGFKVCLGNRLRKQETLCKH